MDPLKRIKFSKIRSKSKILIFLTLSETPSRTGKSIRSHHYFGRVDYYNSKFIEPIKPRKKKLINNSDLVIQLGSDSNKYYNLLKRFHFKIFYCI